MNNETKEILDFNENADYKKLSCDEIKILKDYITNLQQENERLKDQNINEILKKDLEICAKQYKKSDEKLEKYKSRIEKAIEVTKDLKQFVYDELVDRNVCGATETHSKIIDLLNILNGDNNE